MEEVVGHNPALAQDMRLMGGLRKHMPITAGTFFIGTLAISGIPPFAGFWSKDEILGATYAANPLLWLVGFATAGITAFYMFRMYFSTFEGSFRGNDKTIREQLLTAAGNHDAHDEHGHSHASKPHESPWSMTLPLVILAVPSMLIGLVGTPFNNYFEAFIAAPGEVVAHAGEFDLNEFLIMAGSSVGIGLIGITLASLMYLSRKIDPSSIASKIPSLYNLSLNKWYIDDIYNSVFVIGLRRVARQVMEVDYRVVDGAVNLTGLATLLGGEGLKYLETGRAQFYALIVFGAVLGLVVVFSLT
jgi:NAD(P)H-quinone oxidoreductase subunit 5